MRLMSVAVAFSRRSSWPGGGGNKSLPDLRPSLPHQRSADLTNRSLRERPRLDGEHPSRGEPRRLQCTSLVQPPRPPPPDAKCHGARARPPPARTSPDLAAALCGALG